MLTHFLCVPFTGLGLFNGYRGDTWLKNRLAIFKQFVLPSLQAQTEQNFWLWLQFRPEEENNSIVQSFISDLGQIRGLRVVVTYHGITMWDDKYDDAMAERRLRASLDRSLPELKQVVGESDEILLTIQPSDDVYLADAVDTIQANRGVYDKVVGWDKGYIMNYHTLEMAEYNPTTIPPFSAIKFSSQAEFLDPVKHYDYIGPYKSHEYVVNLGFTWIPGRGFIVGTHGENTSTTWGHSFTGRVLSKQERDDVLIKAGLFGVEPLVVTKDRRRRNMKRFLNLFPASWQRWYIRQLSPGVREAIRSYTYFNI